MYDVAIRWIIIRIGITIRDGVHITVVISLVMIVFFWNKGIILPHDIVAIGGGHCIDELMMWKDMDARITVCITIASVTNDGAIVFVGAALHIISDEGVGLSHDVIKSRVTSLPA